ncbi:MAG: NAD(P)-binding domain-containing protein [Chloroflexota bacterium]|jgi:thioredoxin reductase (NADPH)
MSQQQQPVTHTDVIVVGAGPLGIEMAITLARANVDYILIEARQIGDAISRWPPNTYFFSTPEHVALAGVPLHNLDQRNVSGEQYLAYLRTLVEMFDLNLRLYEPVTAVTRQADSSFMVQTAPRRGTQTYRARYVIMATGGMAGPRLLHIPGEDLPHVSHYFPGPHPYFRSRVLIVGGRNSAAEAALRCWRVGAQVTLSYRRPSLDFDRVKPHLSDDLATRLDKGEIGFLPATVPVKITPHYVELASTEDGLTANGRTLRHETDFVLLCTGFTADMDLLAAAGVDLLGERRVPAFDPHTMETNVPGLFVVGTAAGGTQERFEYFISTTHDHIPRILKAILGHVPADLRLGTIKARNNAVTWEEVKTN